MLVEDLISTSGSSIDAANALREVKADPIAITSIFTYGFPKAKDNLEEAKIKLLCLCDYETLIEVAREENKISSDQIKSLKSWKDDPSTWSN